MFDQLTVEQFNRGCMYLEALADREQDDLAGIFD